MDYKIIKLSGLIEEYIKICYEGNNVNTHIPVSSKILDAFEKKNLTIHIDDLIEEFEEGLAIAKKARGLAA